MAEVGIGDDGRFLTWQEVFPETTPCVQPDCGGKAEIAITVKEDESGPYAMGINKNDPDGEGYWVHDCMAVATYLCRKCLKPTSLMNQA